MGAAVVVVGDVCFEGALAVGGGAEEAEGVELVVVNAVGAFDFALEVGLADGCELAGDAFFAQLALEGVLDRDVGEHGIGELGAVVGLDLQDTDAEALVAVESVAQEVDGVLGRAVFVDVNEADA
jgi:hypothetical protein